MGIMCVFGEGGWDGFVLRAVSYCTAGVCVAMWVPCPVRHGVRTYNRIELVSSLITNFKTSYGLSFIDYTMSCAA